MDVNLVLFKKNGSQKVVQLPSKVTIIGRRQDCDLRIPLMLVSRRHCQLILNNETLKIRDLGSRNGTFLNGKRVEEATAQAGDNITIGPLTFAIQINGQPQKLVSPVQPAQKPITKEKQKTKASAETSSGSFPGEKADELSEELSDDLPELDVDENDDFLSDLENI
jgi:pSer/pThr/pTyr-binding forkhead associated (FHA) protein